jgi:photosystem II stability/assembly factor-like uncharacterized protein
MKPNIYYRFRLLFFLFYSLNAYNQLFNLTENDTSFYQILHKMESNFTDSSKLLEEGEFITGESEEDLFLRWQWFWRNGVDKYGGFKKYGEQMNQLIKNFQNNRLKSGSSITWISAGPNSDPIVCPSYPSHTGVAQVTSVWANSSNVYLGCQGGGFWKKEGSSWINTTNNIQSLTVYDIAVDNSGKIYIATGYKGQGGSIMTNEGYGFGIFYSSDGGNTWVIDKMTDIPAQELLMYKVIVHPSQQNIIYALSRYTVYKSIDGGNNWTNTNAPVLLDNGIEDHRYIDMDMKAGDPNIIFICSNGYFDYQTQTWQPGKIYKTVNGAQTWQTSDLAANLKYGNNAPRWIGMAITPADPNSIYAIYRDSNNKSTLEKSTDNGLTWISLVDSKTLICEDYAMHQLIVSPINSSKIYIGGVGLYKYNPSNSSFVSIQGNLHDDFRDFHIVSSGGNDTIFLVNDAGISYSINDGSSWTKMHNGLQGALFYGISNSENSNIKLLGGVGDCGTHLFNGTAWLNTCLGGDGGTSLIDNLNDNRMCAMVNKFYYRTINNGVSWNYTGQEAPEYASPMIQHPDNGRLYISWRPIETEWSCKIKFSDDFGTSWNDFTPAYGGDRITAMAISKSNPNYFYFSKVFYQDSPSGWLITNTILKTTNNGTNWTDISSNVGSIINEARIIDIEIHTTDPNIVWICFGGLADGEKVYQSKPEGVNLIFLSSTVVPFIEKIFRDAVSVHPGGAVIIEYQGIV